MLHLIIYVILFFLWIVLIITWSEYGHSSHWCLTISIATFFTQLFGTRNIWLVGCIGNNKNTRKRKRITNTKAQTNSHIQHIHLCAFRSRRENNIKTHTHTPFSGRLYRSGTPKYTKRTAHIYIHGTQFTYRKKQTQKTMKTRRRRKDKWKITYNSLNST